MSYDNLQNVKVEHRDAVLVVTIDRPKVLNALNAETVSELDRIFVEAAEDAQVKAIVLTGSGEKAFVAGADINELATMTPLSGKAVAEKGQRTFDRIERSKKPVIAAINGFALGGGCELALACHIRIASEKASLGLPEVSLGIIPGYGGTQRLSRLVGKGKALEMILTGDRISAADAERVGLVNKVVAPEQLLEAAEEMARKIASRSSVAVAAALEAVNVGLDVSLSDGQTLEATNFGLLCATEDMKEGMNAFLEKRAANFPGR
jgi:enoyl-CoA hydratase